MSNSHKHHIIPKHQNGSNEPSNIIELTIEEHANIHKELFEKYGRWQDKLAWQGLCGMIDKKNIIRELLSMAGKKGSKISNKKQGTGKNSRAGEGKYGNNPNSLYAKMINNKNGCKLYHIIKDNVEFEITDLVEFCKNNNINYKSFHKQVIQRKKEHKGYTIRG